MSIVNLRMPYIFKIVQPLLVVCGLQTWLLIDGCFTEFQSGLTIISLQGTDIVSMDIMCKKFPKVRFLSTKNTDNPISYRHWIDMQKIYKKTLLSQDFNLHDKFTNNNLLFVLWNVIINEAVWFFKQIVHNMIYQ